MYTNTHINTKLLWIDRDSLLLKIAVIVCYTGSMPPKVTWFLMSVTLARQCQTSKRYYCHRKLMYLAVQNRRSCGSRIRAKESARIPSTYGEQKYIYIQNIVTIYRSICGVCVRVLARLCVHAVVLSWAFY